jgi:hypothetical protein
MVRLSVTRAEWPWECDADSDPAERRLVRAVIALAILDVDRAWLPLRVRQDAARFLTTDDPVFQGWSAIGGMDPHRLIEATRSKRIREK